MEWVYIWLGVVVVSLVLEFVTMELVSIWISFGGFVGMILALCEVNYIVQLIVAIAISIACILGLRKVTLKFLTKNQDKTNLDLAVGTHVKLLEDVTEEQHGSAKYNGVVWSVKAEDETKTFKAGTLVEIVKVEGNKLIVKKAPTPKEETETEQVEQKPEKEQKKQPKKAEAAKVKKTVKKSK